MPAKSKATLKVSLRDQGQNKPVLVWQLAGKHGEEWSAAQVTWPGARGIQVRTNKLITRHFPILNRMLSFALDLTWVVNIPYNSI